MKKILFPLFILFLIVTMQNCAEGSFQSAKEVTSLTSGNGLSVLSSGSSSDSSMIIVDVRANTELLIGAKSVLWDHVYGEDLVYCEQTTTTDKTVTTFLCPGEGWLTVSLYIEYLNGTQTTKKIKLYITSAGGARETPEEELNGSQLYTLYCSGCHGALDISTKRGVSLSALNTALSSQTQMAGLRDQLTSSDKEAIVEALR